MYTAPSHCLVLKFLALPGFGLARLRLRFITWRGRASLLEDEESRSLAGCGEPTGAALETELVTGGLVR